MILGPADIRLRAERLEALGDPCRLCPRRCGARRRAGETGRCGATLDIDIASAGAHFGEESVLVSRGGSGTIFFSHCNLRCVFCQNHDISQLHAGHRVTTEELALVMLELERSGCLNINLVTPTHYVAGIVGALAVAAERGLALPVVYNCGGYESVEVLELLEGVVDIYMPDAKFARAEIAGLLCDAADYPSAMLGALIEMQRQVGDLRIDKDGCARRGLLVRHLVMPGNAAGTAEVLNLLAEHVSPATAVNVMDQYHPCFRTAGADGPLGRRLTAAEHASAVAHADALGLRIIQR
jgi:putative pyruvate formate lyase activating enzyme